MIKQLSITEKIAAAVSSCVLGALAIIACLKLKVAPSYPDFVVGSITWTAETKLQDLVVMPVFIFALFFGFLLISIGIKRLGEDERFSSELSNQLIWWSLPSFAAILSMVLGGVLDERIFVISAIGILFVLFISVFCWSKGINISPHVLGLSALAVILAGIIPIELAVVLGRLPLGLFSSLDLAKYIEAAYFFVGLGVVALAFYTARYPEKISEAFPKLALLGQIGLPTLFFVLYPAGLLQPDGVVTRYETTIWLKVLVFGIVVWGMLDVISRYRKYSSLTTDISKCLSPVAFFALLVGLKIGNTLAPSISPDDYHFGEGLLGWWSYKQGVVPYVGYMPAHGLIDDDLTQFLSSIFYHDSAGVIPEVGRLSYAFLAFAAFLSIYLFSGSLGLAFASIFFVGGRLAWLFLTPFICFWFSQRLRRSSSGWLSAWLLTFPFVILGVPPQGLLLVVASGVMAAWFGWRFLRNSEERDWKRVGAALGVVVILGVATPLGSMFFGALRYVLENGPLNQVSYGVPWSLSWGGGVRSGFAFEAIRMSWVLIPVACLTFIYTSHRSWSKVFPALVVLLFIFLLIPYSMGRVDPGDISRPGITAAFGWAVLLPVAAWWLIRVQARVVLVLFFVCMTAALNVTPLSLSSFFSAMSAKVSTGPLVDGGTAGLSNIGKAYVQSEHWERLNKLSLLLRKKLADEESYLDLTSRNAQYFYLNRKPMMVVTAPYNMVPPLQQKREVERLSKELPRLVLLEGDNIIHDGGGLALRNPYLYRFVLDNYAPSFEGGFIFGASISQENSLRRSEVSVGVKDLTDVNWDSGVHRLEPAVIIDDPSLVEVIVAGDRVRIGGDEIRRVAKVWREGNAIWLDGDVIDPAKGGYPNNFELMLSQEAMAEYHISLFERAVGQKEFNKIPVSWGRSSNSLKEKMEPIVELSIASTSQLTYENGIYKVLGSDPSLSFDMSGFTVSGRSAGLLKLDFACVNRNAEPRIQIFWWGDNHEGPFEAASVRFTADDGALIVPMDASPRWVMMERIKGIRIDLDNPSACGAIKVNDAGLFQRIF